MKKLEKETILEKDNSETDLDVQPGPVGQPGRVNYVWSTRSSQPGSVNQFRSTQPESQRGGARTILVYTWLCSVANKNIYMYIYIYT